MPAGGLYCPGTSPAGPCPVSQTEPMLSIYRPSPLLVGNASYYHCLALKLLLIPTAECLSACHAIQTGKQLSAWKSCLLGAGWLILSRAFDQSDLSIWPLLPHAKHRPAALQLGQPLPSGFSLAGHHLGCLYWSVGPGHCPAVGVVGCSVPASAPQSAEAAEMQEAGCCCKPCGMQGFATCRLSAS